MNKEVSIIIVAGGAGTRMGAQIPKQFLLLAGKPIFIHTLQQFVHAFPDGECILVMPAAHLDTARSFINQYLPNHNIQLCIGGKTRFHSVLQGLHLATGAHTLIHDAVRPFVPTAFLQALYEQGKSHIAAVPTIDVVESLRWSDIDGNRALDRAHVKIVQTPQIFQTKQLKEAFNTPYQDAFTDDASVMEYAGYKIELIAGYKFNIKITTPEDIDFAEYLLKNTL